MNTSAESSQSRRANEATTAEPKTLGQIRDSARSLAMEGKTEEAVELLVSALDAVLRKSRELELMVLKLQRERVGKRSEKIDPGQLQLMFEQMMSQSGDEEPELDPQTEAREDAELFDVETDREEATSLVRDRSRRARFLEGYLRYAAPTPEVAPEPVVIDEDTERQLRALGYIR